MTLNGAMMGQEEYIREGSTLQWVGNDERGRPIVVHEAFRPTVAHLDNKQMIVRKKHTSNTHGHAWHVIIGPHTALLNIYTVSGILLHCADYIHVVQDGAVGWDGGHDQCQDVRFAHL